MCINHPVENISIDEVEEFIHELNVLSGSASSKIQDQLKELIPDHMPGNIYDLPSDFQREYVMKNQGQANKDYFDRDDDSQIANYAWYHTNSASPNYPKGSTQPVATKLPRIINGQPIYDLQGNVYEYIKDKLRQIPGTIDFIRGMHGGSWQNRDLKSTAAFPTTTDEKTNDQGFRLVRTRP